MVAKVINLRQARKARDRAAARAAASGNATQHGLPKVVRRLERLRRDRDAARLDGKKLDG